MSKDTEKVFRDLNRYLDAHGGDEMSDQEMDRLISQFMEDYNTKLQSGAGAAPAEPETALDYLELAEEARTQKQRLEYTNKALELEPDNLDAGMAKIALTMKEPQQTLEALEALLKKGDAQMEQGGFFRDSMGDFWAVFETRPYMRVRYQYLQTLIALGMLRKAASVGERSLELCENDNLGIRYSLMCVYAALEDEPAALALLKQFGEYEDSQLLLALAVLYYKLDRPDEATDYLKRLQKINKGTKKFLRAAAGDRLEEIDGRMAYGYRPFTADELIELVENNLPLFISAPGFFRWADKRLKAAK